MQAAVCPSTRAWAHGTVVRATRYPDLHSLNLVRVEEDPAMDVDGLVAVADLELAGLAHRRLDFDLIGPAERLRGEFETRGWRAAAVLWMRHRGPRPPGRLLPGAARVPYDAVEELHGAWDREDSPDQDCTRFRAQAREVALARSVEVLARCEDGRPVAFAALERCRSAAEVTEVYVHPEHRRRGLGAAMTGAAIAAAGDVSDLWICAGADGPARTIYARHGFEAVWTTMECVRLP
ncbi:MAG: Acetyltransferase domain [Solirubrobacteraceae bacterium]|nr:Acetyltransferase domain [Solirubrobacteraceae bacterium]